MEDPTTADGCPGEAGAKRDGCVHCGQNGAIDGRRASILDRPRTWLAFFVGTCRMSNIICWRATFRVSETFLLDTPNRIRHKPYFVGQEWCE